MHDSTHDSHTIFLLRHAHRPSLSKSDLGHHTPLSKKGKIASFNLGKKLQGIPWKEIHTSPLKRCLQTAEYFMEGVGHKISLIPTHTLGDPGPFVADPQLAAPLFSQKTISEIMDEILTSHKPLPGMRSLLHGGELFLNYLQRIEKFPCLMISHDIIIALLHAYFSKTSTIDFQPQFLEGVVLTKDLAGIFHLNHLIKYTY